MNAIGAGIGFLFLIVALSGCSEPAQEFTPPAASYTASEAAIERVPGSRIIAGVDSTFFGDYAPLLGRRFFPADYGSSRSPVAILSHAFWMEELGGGPDAVGSTVEVGGVSRTVVGIMPEGVDVPAGVALWVPAN